MEENLKEDILKKIYYNEFDAINRIPDSEEYKEITKKIKELDDILMEQNDNNVQIRQYMEYVNERCGIEAENQFMIGFKTAVKIIFQSLK